MTREVAPKLSASGQYITRSYSYTINGELAGWSDGNGLDWTRTHTAMDQVAAELSPSTCHVEGTDGELTVYSYDSEDNLVKRESPRGTRTSTVDDFATKYSYNATNELVVEHRTGGAVNSYAYDRRGNLVGQVDPNRNWPAGEYAGNALQVAKRRFTYEYDDADNRTAQIEDPGGLALRTRFGYDANDNLVSVTDPRGTVTPTVDGDFTDTREYDGQDLLTAEVDGEGRRTEITRRKDGQRREDHPSEGVGVVVRRRLRNPLHVRADGRAEVADDPVRRTPVRLEVPAASATPVTRWATRRRSRTRAALQITEQLPRLRRAAFDDATVVVGPRRRRPARAHAGGDGRVSCLAGAAELPR